MWSFEQTTTKKKHLQNLENIYDSFFLTFRLFNSGLSRQNIQVQLNSHREKNSFQLSGLWNCTLETNAEVENLPKRKSLELVFVYNILLIHPSYVEVSTELWVKEADPFKCFSPCYIRIESH